MIATCSRQVLWTTSYERQDCGGYKRDVRRVHSYFIKSWQEMRHPSKATSPGRARLPSQPSRLTTQTWPRQLSTCVLFDPVRSFCQDLGLPEWWWKSSVVGNTHRFEITQNVLIKTMTSCAASFDVQRPWYMEGPAETAITGVILIIVKLSIIDLLVILVSIPWWCRTPACASINQFKFSTLVKPPHITF